MKDHFLWEENVKLDIWMGIIYIIIYGRGKLNWYLFDGRESWRINVKLAEDIKLQFKDNFKYKFKVEPKVKLLV